MSAEVLPTPAPVEAVTATKKSWRRRVKPRTALAAYGEPMIWLTGGALGICVVMIVSLLLLVMVQGFDTFWPQPVERVTTHAGATYMGEVTRIDSYKPGEQVFDALPPEAAQAARAFVERNDGLSRRQLFRTGNFELTNEHFRWIDDFSVKTEDQPEWAILCERISWGRFYGLCEGFEIDKKATADSPAAAWALFNEHHRAVRERWEARCHLERHAIGTVGREEEQARLATIQTGLDHGRHSPEYAAANEQYEKKKAWAKEKNREITEEIRRLDAENGRYQLLLRTADDKQARLLLADIVRAYPANQLGLASKWGVYVSRWWEFVSAEPREANSEGGVFPAIFGTVVMTVVMSLAVVPFGVLAALYLREYARAGLIVSIVRIAVNNLAGVPSIVFGVFGLGFFCYLLGASVDQWFFAAKLPKPTYGTGGVLWASLTLALLTLPVVIVATEEALAAVPSSMREGSYACGASKWQTIWHIVLPRALPGIMTGMILAMARGAGEVAPLMLVGAVKLAPELPVDAIFPFIHGERSFMHLGFHIYDVGFQSQNSEAARPMVYTTTMLLICIIAFLNLSAIWLRMRLRRRFVSNQF